MKIVFLADSIVLQSAGIKHYNKQLLDAIASYPRLTQLTLVVPEKTSELDCYDQVVCPIRQGVPMHQQVRAFSAIPRIVRQLNYDVVIEPAHFGPFFINQKAKRVTVIHDLTPLDYPELHPRQSAIVQRLFLPSIIRKADTVITNSVSTQADIKRRFKKESLPIYPRIPTGQIDAFPSTSAPFILSVGTLEPRKNYATLLKSFELVAADHPTLQLVIIGGEGWKNQAFEQLLATSSVRHRVKLTGYVTLEEKVRLMKQASVYVSPSIQEGLGMPLLEMLSSNIPILCSDIPSYKEIGGDQFQYFNPMDFDHLSELINQAVIKPQTFDYTPRMNAMREVREAQLQRLFHTFDTWQ